MKAIIDKISSKKYIFLILSVVCPVAVMSIALFFRGTMPGQSLLLVQGDYTNEYLPFFCHFWDALLHGKSLEYSFAAGLGSPTMGIYSIFAFSPCSIIPYLIEDITLAAYLSLMIKIALASLFFYLFLGEVVRCSNKTAMFFSLFYSLSSYICIYYINIHFIDIFYILPALIYSLVRFVRDDKALLLTGCYVYCFINNFFNGYCTGLFSALAYIIFLWYFDVRGERLKKNILKYILVSAASLLLSAPVLLPAVFFVLHYMAGGSDFSYIPLNDPLKSVLALLFGRTNKSVFNYYPMVYCGWPSFLFGIAFFFDKKNEKKKKILAGILLGALVVCVLWHPAYLMMHLFNEPDSFPWRFSYLLIFVLCTVGAYETDRLEEKMLSAARYIPGGILILMLLLSYFIYSGTSVVTYPLLILNLVFIVAYIFLSHKRTLLYTVMLLEVVCATFLQLPQRHADTDNDQLAQQRAFEDFETSREQLSAEWAGNGFCRTYAMAPSLDASLIYDYPGVQFFCSFENSNLINTLKMLGFGSRSQEYSYMGATDFSSMILSVKYIFGNDGSVPLFMEKEKVLPLAFAVSDEIKSYSPADGYPDERLEDPFGNQQRLADAMTVQDRELFSPAEVFVYSDGDVSMAAENESGDYVLTSVADRGVVYWYTSDEDDDNPGYIFLSAGRGIGIFDKDEIEAGSPFPGTFETTPISIPHIYSFQKPDADTVPLIAMHMNSGAGSETVIKNCIAKRLVTESLNGIYEELSPGGLVVDDFADTEIRGQITADSDHPVLFSSVPYDPDWHIYIDGTECDIYPVVNGTFLACDIPPGNHEIIFRYKDGSLALGWKCFAAGMMLFLLLAIRERKITGEKITTRKNQKSEESI
ncbi:MAG: YfhO family protein [Lachnospiraceae bacterium]|nr:YfhO family protein [Lachnospiraceae bacterium]